MPTVPSRRRRNCPTAAIWRSIVTEEKSKPAETLADYRGNYKYNLLDDNLRAFNAAVPTFALWDNHEVMETWWPDEPLPQKPLGEKNTLAFAARGRRAFHEFMPMRETMAEPGRVYRKIQYGPLLDVFMLDMRSYRGPDGPHGDSILTPDDYLLGPRQVAWLKRELMRSQATWKVIAADSPIGYVVDTTGIGHGRRPARTRPGDRRPAVIHQACRHPQHAVAHRRPALHRRALLRSEPRGIPGFRAVLGIRLRPAPCRNLDAGADGAQLSARRSCFRKPASAEQGENLAPCYGLQFFGHVAIDGATETLTVTLKDVADRALWSITLDPAPPAPAHVTMRL